MLLVVVFRYVQVQCFGVGVVDGVLVVALAGGGVWCWCVQVPL